MRRLRAAFGIGFAWGFVWLPIGLMLAFQAAGSPSQPSDIIARPVDIPIFTAAWTAWGAMSGGIFALLLSVTERRRTVESLSLLRISLWGALGAMTLPAILTLVDVMRYPVGSPAYSWRFPLLALGTSAALGGMCAAATVLVARRARS